MWLRVAAYDCVCMRVRMLECPQGLQVGCAFVVVARSLLTIGSNPQDIGRAFEGHLRIGKMKIQTGAER